MNLAVHAFVESDSADTIAAFFARHGWTVRKAGFTEHEVMTENAELVIEAARPVLVHGPSTRQGYDEAVEILRAIGLPYRAELYEGERCIECAAK